MKHFIDTFLEPSLWFAADWSLRWAALLVVIALALWIARPRRAALRELILLTALAAGLLVPFTPRWGEGWERARQLEEPAPSLSFPRSAWERTPGRSASRPDLEQDATRSVADVRSHAERGNEKTATSEERTSAERSEPLGRRRAVVLSLTCCWSVTVLGLLIRRLGGWLVLRRLRRESAEATEAAADLFTACRSELGVRRRVRLATNPRVLSPILFGLLRPMILVPADWTQRAIETQRAALLHELAHVRRRDYLLAPLLEIIRIAFFFNPLVRWLLNRLEYERELLCDEMVIRQGTDPRDYARSLMEFARESGRLAWSAASLPMSRRRTVKGRIHHLLEEDMERWIRPLPTRWAIVVGFGLLILTLGVASYRAWAEEKESSNKPAEKEKPDPAGQPNRAEARNPATPRLRREELRYGGKNFSQWRYDLLTELKGSIRVDGMKAFAAFGANGYGPEATQAILEIIRGCDTRIVDTNDDDGAIVEVGYRAIKKIGAESIPILADSVKKGNRNARRFAIEALGRLGSDAHSAIPTILEAMKAGDSEMQLRALRAVHDIAPSPKEVIAATIDVLKGNDSYNRLQALFLLQKFKEEARPAISTVIGLLSDKNEQIRSEAINVLRRVGAGKEAVVPVSRLLRDKDTEMRHQAYLILQELGADAKDAVPALIAIVKDPKDINRGRAVNILGNIGPGAKEAIPTLNELLRDNDGLSPKTIIAALKAIDPDHKR